MHFSKLAVSTAALAAGVFAQTPEGSSPVVSTNLGVRYGSTVVTPGIQLPQQQTLTAPTVSGHNGTAGSYTLLLVDLSIPVSILNLTAAAIASLSPGLGANRTTRLHWWQANLTPSANGSLVSTSSALAPYGGPMPPAGDVAHTYTFYLARAAARMNFSVAAAVQALGQPVAANYIRVQNLGNATASSAAGGNATTAATATPSVAPFTGAAAAAAAGAGKGVQVGAVAVGLLAFALL
ncbi:hypothetical protein H2203_000647 [Taxawa tesnikishii (nom. ined.)]|nr:hypothetical protein H2203_000647 [Dothideales sp. JES 119]